MVFFVEFVKEIGIELIPKVATSLTGSDGSLLAEGFFIILILMILLLEAQPHVRLLHRIDSLFAAHSSRLLVVRDRRVGSFLRTRHILLLMHSPLESRNRDLLNRLVFEVARIQKHLLLRAHGVEGGIKCSPRGTFDRAAMRLAVLRLASGAAHSVWTYRIHEISV